MLYTSAVANNNNNKTNSAAGTGNHQLLIDIVNTTSDDRSLFLSTYLKLIKLKSDTAKSHKKDASRLEFELNENVSSSTSTTAVSSQPSTLKVMTKLCCYSILNLNFKFLSVCNNRSY